jgi:hypothetical protein
MGKIYMQAKQVVAWLGSDPEAGKALEFLESSVSNLTLSRQSIQSHFKGLDSSWKTAAESFYPALSTALDRYWSRAWITQEIVLARRVKLLANQVELDLQLIRSRGDLETTLQAHFGLKNPHFETLVRIWELVTGQAGNTGPIGENGGSLFYLLEMFQHKKCAVPQDRVYSLLSLCVEGKHLEVDYNIPDILLLYAITNVAEPLCLCSASVLFQVFDVWEQMKDPQASIYWRETFLEVSVGPSKVKINPPSPTEGGVPYWTHECAACGADLDRIFQNLTGQLFCLSALCRGTGGHLLWAKINLPESRNIGFYFFGKYTQSVQYASAEDVTLVWDGATANTADATIRFSSRFLETLGKERRIRDVRNRCVRKGKPMKLVTFVDPEAFKHDSGISV